MQKKYGIILLLVAAINSKAIEAHAQELNAQVQVLSPQIQATNKQVFKTLENSIHGFLNNTNWTDETYDNTERISCSFVVNVTEWQMDKFKATLQVQYSRPIYRSGYSSLVFIHLDDQFDFQYLEYNRLDFAKNNFTSNLTSVLAYYSYIIIGLDHDTYSLKGGSPFYAEAQNIVGSAQNSGFDGWGSFQGSKSRFWLIDNLVSPAFDNFRKTLYEYHRKGLDRMYDLNHHKTAKETIKNSLLLLKEVNDKRPGSFLIRLFFDAKVNEILSIFNGGNPVPLVDLKELLIDIDANNASKYQEMGKT